MSPILLCFIFPILPSPIFLGAGNFIFVGNNEVWPSWLLVKSDVRSRGCMGVRVPDGKSNGHPAARWRLPVTSQHSSASSGNEIICVRGFVNSELKSPESMSFMSFRCYITRAVLRPKPAYLTSLYLFLT